ncbi:hypothetical protein ACQKCH_11210 [Nubsella zeaxanthinifaciens]|uniref:hypothetical protein n=1 Tax=Nubsella zeaxanthinifaciens TaxID=392412 RepID=UPI003CFC1050
MKIKALIELKTPPYPKDLPILDVEETIYQAYDKFLKSSYFQFLPVFMNGNYLGIITFKVVAEMVIRAYRHEKNEKFRTNRLLIQKTVRTLSLLKATEPTKKIEDVIALQTQILDHLHFGDINGDGKID